MRVRVYVLVPYTRSCVVPVQAYVSVPLVPLVSPRKSGGGFAKAKTPVPKKPVTPKVPKAPAPPKAYKPRPQPKAPTVTPPTPITPVSCALVPSCLSPLCLSLSPCPDVCLCAVVQVDPDSRQRRRRGIPPHLREVYSTGGHPGPFATCAKLLVRRPRLLPVCYLHLSPPCCV